MVRSTRLTERPDFGLDAPPIVYGLAALAAAGIPLVAAGALLANPVLIASGVCDTVVGLVMVWPHGLQLEDRQDRCTRAIVRRSDPAWR